MPGQFTRTRPLVGAGVILGAFLYDAFLAWALLRVEGDLGVNTVAVVTLIAGAINTWAGIVINHLFGSSLGSERKTEMLGEKDVGV